jgi:hypothetical protein
MTIQEDRKCSALFAITVVALSGCNLSEDEAKLAVSATISSEQATKDTYKSGTADNFAVNGGVENGLTHWGKTSGTLSRSTSVSHTGSASAMITNRTATWNGLTFNVGTLTEGNEYAVSVWVKLADGAYDTTMTLTAKRLNDNDSSTYHEYTNIVSTTVSADR